jgi:hypothetical protein
MERSAICPPTCDTFKSKVNRPADNAKYFLVSVIGLADRAVRLPCAVDCIRERSRDDRSQCVFLQKHKHTTQPDHARRDHPVARRSWRPRDNPNAGWRIGHNHHRACSAVATARRLVDRQSCRSCDPRPRSNRSNGLPGSRCQRRYISLQRCDLRPHSRRLPSCGMVRVSTIGIADRSGIRTGQYTSRNRDLIYQQ